MRLSALLLKRRTPADFHQDMAGRCAIEKIAAAHVLGLPELFDAGHHHLIMDTVDIRALGLDEADMVGHTPDGSLLGTTESLDRPADDELKPGIVLQKLRGRLCRACHAVSARNDA